MAVKFRWNDFCGENDAFHVARGSISRPVPRHSHDFAELFWLDAGRGWHRVNGQKVKLQTGEIWFVRPDDVHSLSPDAAGAFRITNVAFPRQNLVALGAKYYPKGGELFWTDGRLPAGRTMEAGEWEQLNNAVDRLARAPRREIEIDHFLLEIFRGAQILPDNSLPTETPDWLRRACAGIRGAEHFTKGTAGFVSLAGRSGAHVARSCQRHLGKTPSTIVNTARIDYACARLQSSQVSVTEIAFECGMENVSHFHHVFKAHTGVSPRQFRQRGRGPI